MRGHGGTEAPQLRLRSEDLRWREVGEEVIALDLREATYLGTNGTGRLLWLALAEGATEEQLAQRLVDACELEPNAAAQDVAAFVSSLRSRDLIEC